MTIDEIKKLTDGAAFLMRNHNYSILEACWSYAGNCETTFNAIHAEIMDRYYK